MVIESHISSVVYTGNGSTRSFPFKFKVWDPGELIITSVSPDGLTIDDVTKSSSIGLTAYGGEVLYPVTGEPLPDGWQLVIRRDMPFVQRVTLRSANRFDPAVIEEAFDIAAVERQQLRDDMSRAIKLPADTAETAEGIIQKILAAGELMQNISQGPQGIQGEPGATGAQGETGPPGIKGDTGERGAPGVGGGFSDMVNVRDYGAVGDGINDDTEAFRQAAGARINALVLVPQGSYVLTGEIVTPATWFIMGATFPGGDTTLGFSDTTRFNGEIVHIESGDGWPCLRVGDPKPWLEQSIRKYSESLAALAVKSGKGMVGVLGASRTSDDTPWTMSAIGLYGMGINDNTVNPEPAWAQYLEARRAAGTGAAYCVEMDMVNTGEVVDVTPDSVHDINDGRSVNLWITNGGGDPAHSGNTASAAMCIVPNPVGFRRGIVMRADALDPALNEAMALPLASKIVWYKGGSVVSGIQGGNKAVEPVGAGVSLGSASNQWEAVYAKKVILSEGSGGITAGIEEAPINGSQYVRKDGGWSVVATGIGSGQEITLSDAVDSTSSTTAASSLAVKTAYDKAVAAGSGPMIPTAATFVDLSYTYGNQSRPVATIKVPDGGSWAYFFTAPLVYSTDGTQPGCWLPELDFSTEYFPTNTIAVKSPILGVVAGGTTVATMVCRNKSPRVFGFAWRVA